MKVGSVQSVDSISSQVSITKINDNDKKKQVTTPGPGYKKKHARLVLKYNRFMQAHGMDVEEEKEEGGHDGLSENDTNEGRDGGSFDPLAHVIFNNDITENERKKIEELLEELNKYNTSDNSSRKIRLNRKNIDEYITILQELRINELYFGRETNSRNKIEGEPGCVIDFKA